MTEPTVAIIVGSGFARTRDATDAPVDTPYGPTSSAIRLREFGERRALQLARHGEKHTIAPHAINYRANIYALREHGAEAIIALNTVGVITAVRLPGELALPVQLIDYTWGREHSYADGTLLLHPDFTQPFDATLRRKLLAAAALAGVDCYDGGVYAVTQGPRLETAAEVDRLERDGADFVGMTAMPEAALARELDVPYACVALVVNRAAGRGETAIHAELESSTQSARRRSDRLLDAFFRSS